MEKFPKANYSPDAEAHNKVLEDQAKARNAHRSLFDKIRGRNAVSGFDLLKEEAYEANALVDRRKEEEILYNVPLADSQEAADEILAGSEFNRTSGEAAFLEGLQTNYPQIAKFINLNALPAAIRDARMVSEQMGDTEAKRFQEGVHALVREKVDTLIRSNDITSMRALLEDSNSELLADAGVAPLLLEMPKELISNKVYLLSVSNIIHRALTGSSAQGLGVAEYRVLKDFQNEVEAAKRAAGV